MNETKADPNLTRLRIKYKDDLIYKPVIKIKQQFTQRLYDTTQSLRFERRHEPKASDFSRERYLRAYYGFVVYKTLSTT